MPKEKNEKCVYIKKGYGHSHGFMGGGFYGLTFIGAAVHYVQQSNGFGSRVLGVLKAIIWPAMLIYKVFTEIKM